MSKFTIYGILWMALGCVIIVFQWIGGFMQSSLDWENIAIVDMIPEKDLSWIDKISFESIQNGLNYLVTMPAFIICFVVGGLFFLLSSFMEK